MEKRTVFWILVILLVIGGLIYVVLNLSAWGIIPGQNNTIVFVEIPGTPASSVPTLQFGQVAIDVSTGIDRDTVYYNLGRNFTHRYQAWGSARFTNLAGPIKVGLKVYGSQYLKGEYCIQSVTPEKPTFSCSTEWVQLYMEDTEIVIFGCLEDENEPMNPSGKTFSYKYSLK